MCHELACRYHSGMRPRTAVLDVGHVGLDKFAVLVPEGEFGDALVNLVAGAFYLFHRRRSVLMHSHDAVFAYGTFCCAGKGGGVDNHLRFETVGVGDGVGKDQTAFGVGVHHLHHSAVVHAQYVAVGIGVAARTVVGGGDKHHHVHGQLVLGHGKQRGGHGSGSGHVAFHVVHVVAGLDVKSAGVVHNAFTHKGYGLFVHGVLGFPFHCDETCLVDAAAVHAQQSAHLERLYLFLFQYFHINA